MGQALRELDPRSSAAAAFGAELRDRRLRTGRSLADLGRSVLVSGDLLGKIEKAQRRPHPDLVRQLDDVLRARGELVRLAAAFIEIRADPQMPKLDEFTPDVAGEQLRSLIGQVRNADHAMAADRLHEVVGYAEAAEKIAPKVSVRRRAVLWRVVAEAHQLAGWMMFDRGKRRSAEKLLARARTAAERARALDVMAYVGGPNTAFMSTWSGDPALGAEQAYGALAWAYRSGNRRLTAFVATMAARAHARMGEADLCRRMLSTAEAELASHRAADPDPDWLTVFDAAALAGHRGSCLLDLGNPRLAVAALQEQERAGPTGFVRNNIIWQLERAVADLHLGRIDEAAAGIGRTLDQVGQGPITPRVLRVFRSVDLQLGTTVRAAPTIGDTEVRLHEFIAACG
ncbi:helix-turn-helix domain-containing protein [Nocardia otitidiscaviarum]|uniref:helix-turn-helix domain-containing protein n=1 Tax=Nocardia otitidiscaviarum TaxID=1823 RepID=UPI00189502AB|nr:helix-turn-helix transcriptional regulator [Nocardia otitidiscaviarum]MBF6183384.1 helix-turn-helix domain-containing protein [Nocardia otitidiscaviarum]